MTKSSARLPNCRERTSWAKTLPRSLRSRSVRQSPPARSAAENGISAACSTTTYFAASSRSSMALLRMSENWRSWRSVHDAPNITSALLSRPHSECTRSLKFPWSIDWLKRCVNFTSHVPSVGMCDVGRERSVSPRGRGMMGTYCSYAKAAVAAKRVAAKIDLVIRCPSADPVAHELCLRVVEVRAALRHAVAGDAGAGDLAVEIRIRRIARRDAEELRHLRAGDADGVGVGAAAGEDEVLLTA